MDNGKIYICPMHPEIQRGDFGICPECGMNLVPLTEKKEKHKNGDSEYNKHGGHKTASFFKKFLVSFALTVPIVLYSDFIQELLGWQPPQFFGSNNYLPLVLSSIIFFYGGWVFLAGAGRELRAKQPGMMTLIGLAVSTAYFYSIYTVFAGGSPLFWELATLITVMLFGHWLEMRAVSGAQGALKELSKLLPDTAEKIETIGKKQATRAVPLAELRAGDLVFVRPGGRIPADGIVAEGQSDANESMITGESAPVKKSAGGKVIAGTINGDGALKIKVTEIGEKTFLAGVMRLVAEAQASKSKIQILSDKAAFYLTIIAVFGGAATLAAWIFIGGGVGFAVERMVAVLVIACPHALGLAVPLVAAISTTLAARNGFLVRRRLALELARKIDIVLFDKTGTLTKGEYGVEKILPAEGRDEKEVLRFAAAVDVQSEHFVARAIVKKAKELNIDLPPVKNFKRIPGKGVEGEVGGRKVFSGGAAALNQPLPDEAGRGRTVIVVLVDGEIVGYIALADLIREESREALGGLKAAGIKTAMITGDSKSVAEWVAEELGIDEYFAEVLPKDKSEKVKELQSRGLKVAMVGDGINDAPALTQADLGIAIGAGTNVAIESAGIILVKNDPRDIVKIIRLSRATYGKMIQNLFWATGYNVVALPLAAGVLAAQGILLQPAIAALFMSLSTVIVAINAVTLRRRRITS